MPKNPDDATAQRLRESFQESLKTQERFFGENWEAIVEAFDVVAEALRQGGKLIVMGNGGSAADAQHLAAELVNRYRKDRPPLAAVALTTDSSILTSVGNDSDFRFVFSRQIEALGKPEDLVVGISTSGNSPNVLEGIRQASRMGIRTLALAGGDGGTIRELADLTLCVDSSRNTPRIQEALLVLEHLLCEWLEAKLFGMGDSK